jgi:hypothetical protein
MAWERVKEVFKRPGTVNKEAVMAAELDLITRIQKKIAEMQEKPLSEKDAKRIALLERQVQFGLAMVERMRV